MNKFWRSTLLALAGSVITTGMAMAQTVPTATPTATPPSNGTTNTANTHAIVDPASNPPVVQFVWMLPDMNSAVAGIQHETAPGSGIHDDDMLLAGVQVKPNVWNKPEERKLEFWAVISDPNGPGDITGAYIDAYHPNGSFKYELSMIRVAEADAQNRLGNRTTEGTVLNAAVDTGQLTAAEADTLYNNVGIGKSWELFHVVGTISKDQPYGKYRFSAIATDTGGGTALAVSRFFDVLQVLALIVDFKNVNYGSVKPGAKQVVPGDRNFKLDNSGNPDDDTLPTVMNVGNVYLNLAAQWSRLRGATWFKEIDHFFDITVGTQNATPFGYQLLPSQAPQSRDLIYANQQILLDQYVLESDVPTQLDLSLQPYNADPNSPNSLPNDVYTGTLTLWGLKSVTQNPNGQP